MDTKQVGWNNLDEIANFFGVIYDSNVKLKEVYIFYHYGKYW